MNTSFLETNIMSIVLFILLFFSMRHMEKERASSSLLNKTIFFIAVSMLADIVYYYVDGKFFAGARLLNSIFLVLYFVASAFGAYYWMRYNHYELYKTADCEKWKKWLCAAPMFLLILMTILSPITHWIFYINDQNIYIRGNLYFAQLLLTYGYIIVGALFAFKQYTVEILADRKRHCLNLCIYTILPLIGGAIQVACFGVNAALPAMAVSVVMIYIDNLKQDISLDSLTKLNNRRQFDSYLTEKVKAVKEDALYLIFFDIDHFKQINDTFGHQEGDKALMAVSELLKTTFADAKSFLARYGGDEFAVVMNCDEQKVALCIQKFHEKLAEISGQWPFALSVSIGYSKYGLADTKTAESLIRAADQKMYDHKQKSR